MAKIQPKIILAFLHFLCVLKMPYGYYQFVRIACILGVFFIIVTTIITCHKNDNGSIVV